MKRPDHSIVYTGGGGRLGNQLIRFAHWLAWTRSQGGTVEIINMAFWPFARYFQAWSDNPGCIFPQRRVETAALTARMSECLPNWLRVRLEWRWQSLVQNTGKWWPDWQSISLHDEAGEQIDLESPLFAAKISRSRVTTCRGWKIACWRLFEEQQTELRQFFLPDAHFLRHAHEFIEPIRNRYDVVAGVLIRQSDYRLWRDGRFHFSSTQYANWIRQLVDLYGARRVAVIVASDERQDPSVFSGLPCYFATGSVNEGGHWFESFTQLSLCDFILSPPSTFSAAAAFTGKTPLWPLVETHQTLALDQVMTDAMVQAARHPLFSAAVK